MYNMSRIQKSHMRVSGNTVQMTMPFAKVDKENRLVSGYATLDNIDSQDDVVLAEASVKAFARARGNIREMHQPIAAGRIVDFYEKEYYDPNEKKFYSGIFVTARVSEGAESTWQKVLDGTLSGFSIGGEILDSSSEFVKDANGGRGGTVRFIKDYDLVELSLVDNPANQLANVLSIQKSATGSVTVKMGAVSDAVVENVFMCPTDYTVVANGEESEECPMCGTKMNNIGWFESNNGDRAEKVRGIVSKFLSPDEKGAAPSSESEGGVEMAKSEPKEGEQRTGVVNPSETHPTGEKIEESDETTVPADEDESQEESAPEDVDETADTEEEESAESPEEVEEDEDDTSKELKKLHDLVSSSLKKNREETAEHLNALEQKIDDATKQFMTKASELETKVDQYGEELKASKARLADFEKMLVKMNASEAIKKSADLEPDTAEPKTQSDTSWNGAFSGKRSRFSVDNMM